jgi:hypothetical protein
VKVSQRKEEEGFSYSWATDERCCSSWATHLPTPTRGTGLPLGQVETAGHSLQVQDSHTDDPGLAGASVYTQVPSSHRAGAQPSCVRQLLVTITKYLR